MSVVLQVAVVALQEVMTKKRKAIDREAKIAEAVAAAAKAATSEAAERGGRSGALRIGSDLTPTQRSALLQVEQRHRTPASTIMLGGRRVRINVTEPGQEEPETEAETEVEAQVEG